MDNYDFSGWATRANIKCSDGRTITKDAFKHHDGETVPLVWNHDHNDPNNVLGQALLQHRDEGIYAYGKFNNSESGQAAKELVNHGDVVALSIYANKLKQQGGHVLHGAIREVSLVLAGANPGAFIDSVMAHGEESEEEAVIFNGEDIIVHSSDNDDENENIITNKNDNNEQSTETDDEKEDLSHSDKKGDSNMAEKTVKDVFDTLTEEQKTVVYAMIGEALEQAEGDDDVKHNVFEDDYGYMPDNVLSHSDMNNIISMAKQSNVGSFQTALGIYADENDVLAHGIDEIESLFPEYKDVRPGAPEFIERDQGWVTVVMNGVHKSPISRIRTRQADITGADLRAKGYKKKGDEKTVSGNIKLLKRTTDPQTVYRKDALHRDDIVDITDFDVVEYQYRVMKQNLNEEIATAIMIGDGREDGDENKISQEHIRSIWHDEELYSMHVDIDYEAAKAELQGSNTGVNFGENYIKAEATINAALYAREKYKGTGTPAYFCTPHALNVMLLARDLNGRRMYDSKADLAKALNVSAIHTAEQFEGKTREIIVNGTAKTKKLVGIFVNLVDYQVGSTKGGEITKFEQFDIDFNQMKYLIETRLSGALTKVKSAIVLEEDVTSEVAEG